MLTSFRAAKYRVTLTSAVSLRLPPYMGNTLRGGFGAAFKRLVCVYDAKTTPCEPCLLRNTCPYGALFEPGPPPGSEVLRNLTNIPRPFVLEPPLDGKSCYDSGEPLEVGLVLVGRAIYHLPYFIVALQELGRAGLGVSRGTCAVKSLHAVNGLTGAEALVYGQGRMLAAGDEMTIGFRDADERASLGPTPDEITVRFLTPTRLGDRGTLAPVPEFSILIRSLLRRISSLAYFYCGERWNFDFRRAKEEATRVTLVHSKVRWRDWQRHSARQNVDMKLGGFVGEATYRGPMEPFLPLLLLGATIHVGKACTFGHGRYELRHM